MTMTILASLNKLSKGKHKVKCHAMVSDTNYFWQERWLLAS